jgi:hypothetical protein
VLTVPTETCVHFVLILQDYHVATETRVSKPLFSNGRFVLLNYSGFEPSCHNMLLLLLRNCRNFEPHRDISGGLSVASTSEVNKKNIRFRLIYTRDAAGYGESLDDYCRSL